MKAKGRLALGDVTHHNIKQLKRLNQVIFPVSYNDKFYKDILDAGDLAKLAFFNDVVVGAVCCRLDTTENRRRLYIMTLGCLAPYRRHGLGTLMLQHVFEVCRRDPAIESIFLHVQVNNESALDFYKRFDFEIVETNKNYYKRIEPADAYILEKRLSAKHTSANHSDHATNACAHVVNNYCVDSTPNITNGPSLPNGDAHI